MLDEIPPVSHLTHISGLHARTLGVTTQDQSIPPSKEPLSTHLGGGLRPVPGKLVKTIEEGHFIDIGELLPEQLSSHCEDKEQIKSKKPKPRAVTNIPEWLQCFGILYVAIISRKKPHRMLDLLADYSGLSKVSA